MPTDDEEVTIDTSLDLPAVTIEAGIHSCIFTPMASRYLIAAIMVDLNKDYVHSHAGAYGLSALDFEQLQSEMCRLVAEASKA